MSGGLFIDYITESLTNELKKNFENVTFYVFLQMDWQTRVLLERKLFMLFTLTPVLIQVTKLVFT